MPVKSLPGLLPVVPLCLSLEKNKTTAQKATKQCKLWWQLVLKGGLKSFNQRLFLFTSCTHIPSCTHIHILYSYSIQNFHAKAWKFWMEYETVGLILC